jgi:gamma-glutamyl-gamma-aminobutyrate hydrolase PuuD
MRISTCPETNERRDCIDQRWFNFFHACNLFPILLPNNFTSLQALNKLDGVVLTGGNSLSCFGGDASERDKLELKICGIAEKKSLPLLGVCRGMQIIQSYYSIELKKIPGHVQQRHNLNFQGKKINVNSYHDYGSKTSCAPLETLAASDDAVIKALRHESLPFLGIMWHPEREVSFSEIDIALFRKHFS